MFEELANVDGNEEAAVEVFRLPAGRIADIQAKGFSAEEIFDIVAPRRTLARRKHLLNLVESDRVARLERILDQAMRVFGNRQKAFSWLRAKSRALDGIAPMVLLRSESGAWLVEQELVRIDHGIF